MYHKEIDLLSEALISVAPKKCLEWGSGFSTVFFPELLSEDASWLALEHNGEWHKIISEANTDRRVGVVHIPADQEPYTDAQKDGAYADFRSYIEYPKGKFDFIFIDGRARKECVRVAHGLVKEEGLVVLHDANRVHYHDHFDLYQHQVLFDDHHTKYGGIWFGSKNKPIADFIDIEKHKKVWRKHYKLAKILNPF